MKKNNIIYLIPLLSIALLAVSCDNSATPPGIDNFFTVSIDNTAFVSTSDYDFGPAEPGGDGIDVTVKFINASGADLTVTDATLSDTDNFSLSGPELPFTASAGSETAVSLTFKPGLSGALSSVLTVSIEGAAENYTLNLKGSGNYAPVVKFGVSVGGAGISAVNGFYSRDGFFSGSIHNYPAYKKAGTVDYFIYCASSDGDVWSLDTTLGNTGPLYYHSFAQTDTMSPQETTWTDNMQNPPAPAITTYDIKGVYMQVGSTITAAYLYSDPEGDPEDASKVKYQWYRSVNQTDDSQFSAVSGATSKNYTLQPGDVEYFFRVKITTAASSGFTGAVSYMSNSTVGTEPLPQ